jgi:hypothetical protein
MEALMGFGVILGFIVCYLVGRAAMSAMGIIMFDTAVGIVIKPIIFGFFIIFIGICLVCLFFKFIFWILGALLAIVIALLPFAVIIGLIFTIIRIIRNKD